ERLALATGLTEELRPGAQRLGALAGLAVLLEQVGGAPERIFCPCRVALQREPERKREQRASLLVRVRGAEHVERFARVRDGLVCLAELGRGLRLLGVEVGAVEPVGLRAEQPLGFREVWLGFLSAARAV